jgi:hypothetical protein
MDTQILSGISIALSVGTVILGVVNHKRIRSTCCGKKVDASFDIEDTTPNKTSTPSSLKDPPLKIDSVGAPICKSTP